MAVEAVVLQEGASACYLLYSENLLLPLTEIEHAKIMKTFYKPKDANIEYCPASFAWSNGVAARRVAWLA